MKSFIIIFITLAIVAATNGDTVSNVVVPSNLIASNLKPVTSLQLGTLLKPDIIAVVAKLVKFISTELLEVISGKTKIPVPKLLDALKSVDSATVGQLILGGGKLLGVNLANYAAQVPKLVADIRISISVFRNILISKIPGDAKFVTLLEALALLDAFLNQVLPPALVALFNKLS